MRTAPGSEDFTASLSPTKASCGSGIVSGKEEIDAQVITKEGVKPIHLFFQNLTADERTILEKGCLMNYYKSKK